MKPHSFVVSLYLLLFTLQAWAQQQAPAQKPRDVLTSPTGPMSNFTIDAILQTFLVGVLVVILLAGGILVVNFGLLSKRREDHTGHRDPSDVGVFKDRTYPDEGVEGEEDDTNERSLPAAEGESAFYAKEYERPPIAHREEVVDKQFADIPVGEEMSITSIGVPLYETQRRQRLETERRPRAFQSEDRGSERRVGK
jgi:hypothetical protein